MSGGRVVCRAALATALVPFLLALAGPARAHTQLISTEPGDRAVVAGATEVSLRFDGELLDLGAAMRVTGPGGEVSSGRPSVDGTTMTQPLRAGLADGSYQVLWRATAADGHAASGEWVFTVSGSGRSPAAPAAAGPGERPAAPTAPEPGWLLDAMIGTAVLALLAICGVVLVARRRRAG